MEASRKGLSPDEQLDNLPDPDPGVGTDAFFILGLHIPCKQKLVFPSVSKSRSMLSLILSQFDATKFLARRDGK